MDVNSATLRAALHILLTLQQVGSYTYRNQRKFTEDIDWSYAGTLNQNNWAKKFPSCSNAKQSPINVEDSLAQVKLEYQKLRLDGWDNLTGQRTSIKNDGKTVALDVDGDFYISGGGLGSKFKVGRITFHWGRCNASSEGSEHSLDGVKYPLEMQIYCYEPHRFDSFHQTVKAGGRITALAVLFEASLGEDNSNFTTIIDAINSVSRYGKSAQVAPFSPRALLPHSTEKYFIYNGSLTTPPCIETVEWIIFKNSVYISPDQLEVFCEVMTMQQAGYVMLMDYLQNNYREQQHNFMGQVFSSYTGTEELLTPVCSSEPENMEATAYNLSSLLVTWERPRAVYDSAIEKYLVSYKMADAEDAAPLKYMTDGDQDVGAILDDLVANYSYMIQVVAVCSNGLYGRISNELKFTMPIEDPGNSLNPYSNEFDYEEENYSPDPSLNESMQTEDYERTRIPTESPLTSTLEIHHHPPQHGVRAAKTESTTIATTSSPITPSSQLPEVTTRFSSTTALYKNQRDYVGGIVPKSFSEAGLNMTTPTVSSSLLNNGEHVPQSGITTPSIMNKTMTRPMTSTMQKTMIKAMNRSTAMTANTTEKKSMTIPMDHTMTKPMSNMNVTTPLIPNTNANKTETLNNTTAMLTNVTVAITQKTTTMIPPMDKSMSVTRARTVTMNTATAVTPNTNTTTNKTRTTPLNDPKNINKTINKTIPLNKTTAWPTTKTMNKTTTNTTMVPITNETVNKTTTMTSSTNRTLIVNKFTNMISPNNKTMTRPTINPRTKTKSVNKTSAVSTKVTATTTLTTPTKKTKTNIILSNATFKNSTATTKNLTTNLTHHSDQIIKPSSVPSSPHKPNSTTTTEDTSRFRYDYGGSVPGEPSQESLPRGPTTPSIPHFSATKTSVWQGGVLLQTTSPLSKGEHLSVLPNVSPRSSLLLDVMDPDPFPVPSTCLHELPTYSALDSSLLPQQILASPTSSRLPLSFANDLVSVSGDSSKVSEWGVSPPQVSRSLTPTLGCSKQIGITPQSHQDAVSRPTISFADVTLESVSSGGPAEIMGWEESLSDVSLSLSPTLRPSVPLSSDFPLSVATPALTSSNSNEVELLGYGTGSTADSFLPEDGVDDTLETMCGCSMEPSASWPHASSHVTHGAVASTPVIGVNLLVTSLGILENSFSVAASGDLVVLLSPSSSVSHFLPATHSAPPLSGPASTTEPVFSPPSGSMTRTSAEGSNSISGSGSHIDQEWDGVQVSGSGESMFPHSNHPPSTTLESGQAPQDVDDRSSAFYFDSESGSAIESGRAGTATPNTTAVLSPTTLEESGSGHADNLYDNDTSSDFSIPEQTQQESKKEEEPMADVSNSSHESRVGSIRDGERKAVVPLAIISTLTALGLVVLIGILIYWRTCFQTAHFYVDESSTPCVTTVPTFMSDKNAALPVKDFVKYVAELHQTSGFQPKFELLKESYEEAQACTTDMVMTSETSNHPDNKSKNRYSNIHAFDHSRVRLSAGADKDGRSRDYINANFVDGFKMHRAYIATQGPLKSSTNDFWQMIWEQNVGVIVMITNLLEKGRRKCDQYWPDDNHEDYGDLVVTLKSIQELAHYTQRTFAITNTHVKKGSQRGGSLQRVVTQYHYTQWPDMGVPDHALPLISFIRKSSQARTSNMGPVVVHCSAGVGRTGTYLVLDSMLRQMKLEDSVDVDGFLQHIRTQRNYLVQTQEQYVFIHNALVEAILFGDTEVEASRLHTYVERLLTPLHDGNTPLHEQFKLLSAETTSVTDYSSALHCNNRQKNRSGSLLPVERSRVHLSPCAGDTSNYINASYVTGYRHNKEFIIAQNPLPDTIKDFWKMVWDHNTHFIVSLQGPNCPQDEEGAEEVVTQVFWPGKDSPLTLETLTVTQTCENTICLANEDVLVVHHLAVHTAQDDFVLEVCLYSAPRWPNPDRAISDTFLLVDLLREQTSSKEGPSIVLDRMGGVTAGTFCALSSLIGQLRGQRSVDVFQVAKMTNLSRPGTFCTTDQLEFLYEALLSVVNEQQNQEDEPRRKGSASRDHNGAPRPARGSGLAESLESLV